MVTDADQTCSPSTLAHVSVFNDGTSGLLCSTVLSLNSEWTRYRGLTSNIASAPHPGLAKVVALQRATENVGLVEPRSRAPGSTVTVTNPHTTGDYWQWPALELPGYRKKRSRK